MQFLKSNKGIQLIIVLVSALLFIPFLGQVHLLDWDEINFAESAREMIVSGNYLTVQINFEPFWEKPPLFIWMQVLSMRVFGINEFAARFPNAIAGIFTLLTLYNIGRTVYNKRFGIIWTMVYAGSFLPFFYFKSGIIDPWFNLFIFAGVYFVLRYFYKPTMRDALLAATAIGLSILTKGPVGLLIAGLTALIYLIVIRFKIKLQWAHFAAFTALLTFVGGFWFILQIIDGNFNILVDFIEYQIYLFSKEGAGHGGFFLYHFVVLFIGVFPASVFALKSFSRKYDKSFPQQMRLMMTILFWTVLILFTIVSTKIVHYSSMCYFPLTFLAAYVMYLIIENKIKGHTWMLWTTGVVSSLYILLIAALPWVAMHMSEIIESGIIKDKFTIGNLQANVFWSGWESAIAVILIVTFIIFRRFWIQKRFALAFGWLYGGMAVFTFIAMSVITPRIEGYTQRTAIEFYKGKATEDNYIQPLGYKSYAHYFYGQCQMPENPKAKDKDWLLKGDIDKKAWFVVKVHKKKQYMKWFPNLVEYKTENGFAFLYREPKQIKTTSND